MVLAIIAIIALGLMAKMTYDMAKYTRRHPWLWAALTLVFGAFPMAYVFYTGKYCDE